ncbi:hypothetical protein ElyMa_001767300, partial [Elysia marginata]
MCVNSLSQGLNVDLPKAGLEPQTSRSDSRASTTRPRRHTCNIVVVAAVVVAIVVKVAVVVAVVVKVAVVVAIVLKVAVVVAVVLKVAVVVVVVVEVVVV